MSYNAFVKLIRQMQSGSIPVVFELTANDIADLISLVAGRKESIKLKTNDGREIEVRHQKKQ